MEYRVIDDPVDDPLDIYEFVKVWRDNSPPAFTAESPQGSHAAWWFSVDDPEPNKHGPYLTRRDAEKAAMTLLRAEAEHVRGVLNRAIEKWKNRPKALEAEP